MYRNYVQGCAKRCYAIGESPFFKKRKNPFFKKRKKKHNNVQKVENVYRNRSQKKRIIIVVSIARESSVNM